MNSPFYSANPSKGGERVYGYYVKCRSRHYILQAWNESGYDERWEAHEWVEINIESLHLEDADIFFNS